MKSLFAISNALFLFLLPGTVNGANELYTPLEAWVGEFLPRDYGGVYVKIQLQGFKKNQRSASIASNVFVHLQEVNQGKRYVLSQGFQPERSGHQTVWKIPIGNYLVQKISLNDNAGLTRIWNSRGKPLIFVRRLFLSNLGIFLLAPGPGKTLLTLFQAAPSEFVNNFQHDTFVAVMDGYTQKLQKKLGGADVVAKAEGDFSTSEEARALVSTHRQISMLYKIDLGINQNLSKGIATTLASQDLDLRTCYMDQLDQDATLHGKIRFRFHLNKNEGAMKNIDYQGGTLNSKKVTECLYFVLGKMQFRATKNLVGLVTFYFNFKDEAGRTSP